MTHIYCIFVLLPSENIISDIFKINEVAHQNATKTPTTFLFGDVP
jgi:hypothetical protein